MACPHVAGAAALIFTEMYQDNGALPSVAEVEKKLKDTALKGKVKDKDGNLPNSPAPNLLLNVDFYFGPTPAPTPAPPTAAPTPAPPIAPSDCSFESGNCFWLQDKTDKFDWSAKSGRTPSSGTGPSKASDGSKYLFIETSSPRVKNDEAVLASPAIALSTNQEIVFDYNMNGASIGALYFLVNNNTEWQDGFNRGDVWKTVVVDLSAYTGNDVILEFVGVRGNSWQGDVAIDNVRFRPSSAQPVPMPVPSPTAPMPMPLPTAPVPMPMPLPTVPMPMPVPPPAVPLPMPVPPPAVPMPMPVPPPTAPVVVPGPPGPPGPAGPPGPVSVGPPGPPGPPR